jgi:hypothetical protein
MIGFDFFTNIKTDYFMKYSDLMIGPRPGYDLDDEENEESIVEFEVQLTDKILTEKRSYSKSTGASSKSMIITLAIEIIN